MSISISIYVNEFVCDCNLLISEKLKEIKFLFQIPTKEQTFSSLHFLCTYIVLFKGIAHRTTDYT